MNLEDWGNLDSFESVIPCTTPTWALYALKGGEPHVQRVVAWQVRQDLQHMDGKAQIWAYLQGLTAGCEGVEEAEECGNFVRYLDEAELDEAPAIALAWLKVTAEAKAREAARKQQQKEKV